MIGFDLDGVLINDIWFPGSVPNRPNAHGLQTCLSFRIHNALPLFFPEDDYVIITGRPIIDKDDTLLWLDMNISEHPPIAVYHDRPWIPGDFTQEKHEMGGAKYKISVLNSHPEIDTYIESSPDQVEYIRENVTTGCNVVWFGTVIRDGLQQNL